MNHQPSSREDARNVRVQTLYTELQAYSLNSEVMPKWYMDAISWEIANLLASSPYPQSQAIEKISHLNALNIELRNNLRRSLIDSAKQRGIESGRIREREMAREGHVSLLFQSPDHSQVHLFWEWDSAIYLSRYLVSKQAQACINKDWSITVVYNSKEHRELREAFLFFRWTCDFWPEEEDRTFDIKPIVPSPVCVEDPVLSA